MREWHEDPGQRCISITGQVEGPKRKYAYQVVYNSSNASTSQTVQDLGAKGRLTTLNQADFPLGTNTGA
jgi:hypothetical protein